MRFCCARWRNKPWAPQPAEQALGCCDAAATTSAAAVTSIAAAVVVSASEIAGECVVKVGQVISAPDYVVEADRLRVDPEWLEELCQFIGGNRSAVVIPVPWTLCSCDQRPNQILSR